MLTGGCLCGKVRYEIDGKASGIWFCHCSKCRRSTGSAFVAAAACRETNFRWLCDSRAISEFSTESGYRRRFCATCGSPAPSYVPDRDFVWLPAGSLDGDPGTRPRHHIFVGSKAPWLEITDSLPQFEEHAPRNG